MSQCCVWDFTLKAETSNINQLKTWLKEYCKKWCFQKERGEQTGYEHYQGRFSLKIKDRLETIKNKCPFKDIHLSITSNENRKNNFYVIKDDTRIEGPWKDDDPTESIRYIPRQIREITTFRPWQMDIYNLLKTWDPRSIHIIIDTRGNNGKTILKTYCGVHNVAKTIPFCNDYKDIMRMVMDMPKVGAYIIDMPRAIKKEKLYQLFAGIETIKDGYAYDDRYTFKDEYFDCPGILVFTNNCPDLTLLSQDRWKLWKISEDFKLEPWSLLE